jgi:hypothetical protein
MSVSELIAELKKSPPEREIVISVGGKLKSMTVAELVDGLKQCKPDVPVTFKSVPKLEGLIDDSN